jgi:hypothetical protein
MTVRSKLFKEPLEKEKKKKKKRKERKTCFHKTRKNFATLPAEYIVSALQMLT